MRTFLAVEVPKHVRKRICSSIEKERQEDLPIKWVILENMHITLKFLGEIDEQKKREIAPLVKEIAGSHRSFEVSLKGVGCFPDAKRPRVLWVGADQGGEELCTIVRAFEEGLARCGFKKEKRFHPHLTLGRIKKPCVVDNMLEKNIVTESFRVDAIVLFKSTLTPQGAVYKELERFPLK